MSDLNYCSFIGRLGKDPEMKAMPSGESVTNFSIAVGESWKDKSGQKVERTEWINCVAFKGLADVCGNYLQKGSRVFVSGKMRTRKWEKDGVTKYTTEIVVGELNMLDSRSDHASPPANESVPEKPMPGAFDDFDDSNIPF